MQIDDDFDIDDTCGSLMWSIECESDDVAFIGGYLDNDLTFNYQLEVTSDIDYDFDSVCTLKIFYDHYYPDEEAG